MLYAVCTNCTFLRAFSRDGQSLQPPSRCPVCHSELMVRRSAGRFQPTYLGRVSLDLHSAPPLTSRPPD